MDSERSPLLEDDHSGSTKEDFNPHDPLSFNELSEKDPVSDITSKSGETRKKPQRSQELADTKFGNGDLHGSEGYGSVHGNGDVTKSGGGSHGSSYSQSSRSQQNGHAKPIMGSKPKTLREKMCGTSFVIYLSHFLSAWGDRMWTFAVGLFLVDITPNSLQLTAAFGLTMGICVLLFGAIVGDWVDSTPRLRAAQISLGLQNVFIVFCAGIICAFLEFREEIESWGDWAPYVAYILIIVFASAAELAHIANTIAVEKDWIVEICGSDEDYLATMTATMRAIDQTALIAAPIATGQIMTFASSQVGALFIAGWNIVSFFFEYFLLLVVYNTVPALRKRKDFKKEESDEKEDEDFSSRSVLIDSVAKTHIAIASYSSSMRKPKPSGREDDKKMQNGNIGSKGHKYKKERDNACVRRLRRMFSGVTIIVEGWKTYARYDVMLSGLALALLYMTVLGFDNVTVGYAYIQGLTESEVSLMMGGGAFMGIMGTLTYPLLRRCIGLPWTGMLALTLQNACLSMCVVSVFLPGSPFDLGNPNSTKTDCVEMTKIVNFTTPGPNMTASTPNYFPEETLCYDLTSVAVLMAGIIAARFGLWIADLAITQMFLETVIEQERGVVNGVQQSLNQLLDMIKFGLVIGLPLAPQFGLLVFLSFAFVFSGWILYLIFLCRTPTGYFRKAGTYEKV